MRNIHFFLVIIPLSILALSSASKPEGTAAEKTKPRFHKQKNDSDTLVVGRQLALKYCQSCHIFPEPDLLDKKTWAKSVLPNMGLRLGIKEAGKNPYADLSPEEEKILKDLVIYPDSPVLTKEEWLEIVNYYEKTAPSVLPMPNESISIAHKLPQFTPSFLTFTKKKAPKTTMLKFDKATTQLYTGDAQNELFIADSTLRLVHTINLKNVPSDIDFPKKGQPRLLTIGSMRPSDLKLGQLSSLDTQQLFIKDLQRPVNFAASDLNRDGKEDLIIAQFGNNSGKLSWFDAGNPQKEHILKAIPGARKVEVQDMNGDSKPDIVVLMAQAYEELVIFYNQGKGKFKEKKVVQCPPVYGVSYFEMVDFNKDGFLDILLTNGDNWDYSAIKKPYHGIRIYLNDGRDNFKESLFIPLFGTSKAVARDFDKDGDLDIAAIAFYTDLDQPEHSFLYFKNEGNGSFTTFSTPEAAYGKWLTMEVGDFDKDGDEDIVLGSYFHTVSEMTQLMFQGIQTFPQLLFLKNNKTK